MRKKQLAKRMLALSLATAMMLPATARAAYQDTAGHWAESAIEKWSGKYGILNGYDDGTFRPDNTITRGAFAGIMSRFLQYIQTAPPDTFSDTAGDYWESDILKLNAAGVYLGTDGKALIYNNITRQQAVTMMARAFGLAETEGELPYGDRDAVAEYARGYLMTMQTSGYITDVGADGLFRPAEPITRAEVVNILNNMISVLFQAPGEYSQNVKGTAMVNAAGGAQLIGMSIDGDLIIAPGVTGTVTLHDVDITGEVRNLGGALVDVRTTPVAPPEDDPKNPEMPEVPEDPWETQDPETPEEPEEPRDYFLYNGQKIPIHQDLAVNTLTASDFYWNEYGRLECSNPDFRTRFGIDVSAYQNRACPDNTIDWDAVAADGVDFAMVRIALRGYSNGALHADSFYAENIDGAMAAGIDTGVYIFSQAITVEEAIEEAEYVIGLLDGRELTGPVAYDWEMGTSAYRVYGIDPKVASACAEAFCRRIEEAGYQPMIYCSKYVGYLKFNLSDLQGYPIWYPEYKYPTTDPEKVYPGFFYQMDYWQYTDKAKINGISGNVDANIQLIRR